MTARATSERNLAQLSPKTFFRLGLIYQKHSIQCWRFSVAFIYLAARNFLWTHTMPLIVLFNNQDRCVLLISAIVSKSEHLLNCSYPHCRNDQHFWILHIAPQYIPSSLFKLSLCFHRSSSFDHIWLVGSVSVLVILHFPVLIHFSRHSSAACVHENYFQ